MTSMPAAATASRSASPASAGSHSAAAGQASARRSCGRPRPSLRTIPAQRLKPAPLAALVGVMIAGEPSHGAHADRRAGAVETSGQGRGSAPVERQDLGEIDRRGAAKADDAVASPRAELRCPASRSLLPAGR